MQQTSLENVAVLLTPPGAAAIAVVRLSGDRVGQFLAGHFSQPTRDGRCVHGSLSDDDANVIDDPVVVLSAGGTIADLNLHGGAWVIRAVLNLAERNGFAVRTPAEAPEVAYDAAGALEREVLEHLPRARTPLALRTLLAQPEAWARFKPRADREQLRRVLADESLARLLEPPVVAIIGAPNVGKSTLANQLFAQERSITADVPGTTRDWVGEIANVDGLAVMLVDTPGQRATSDAIEREAIERSRGEVGRADLVVVVLDATRSLTSDEDSLLRTHPSALRVINKVDLAPAHLGKIDAIPTIARTGEGVDRLRDEIRSRFGCLDVAASTPRAWTERQRTLIVRAMDEPGALDGL